MKYLFLISMILILTGLNAEGPLFHEQDPNIQQEFENVYQDIRSKSPAVELRTKAQLVIEVPTNTNLIYVCSDCSVDGIIISTGITAGSFARATSRTTAIQ